MISRCMIACRDCPGCPTIFGIEIECTEEEYALGIHYDKAEAFAEEHSYERPYVVFDENDGPDLMFENWQYFKWLPKS